MKKLFDAIKKNNFETVKMLIEKNGSLVNCTATKPPQEDDGQSPLQVAIKNRKFAIAEFLLNMGANVNFIESENCSNNWRTPVIHDAINCAIMCSRFNTLTNGQIEIFNSKETAEKAYALMKKIIELGANVNAVDSYGNSCLDRACLQASQILPTFNHTTQQLCNDRLITTELIEDLSSIFNLLIQNGADLNYKKDNKTIIEKYNYLPVGKFLKIN